MNLELSTPALLFPAIAILMLGYVNRYLGTANVIRKFKKDFDSDYKHTELIKQLKVLKKRIELSRIMLMIGAIALMLACTSMAFLFFEYSAVGEAAFAASISFMILSLCMSLYETSLSNRSLLIEIEHMVQSEQHGGR